MNRASIGLGDDMKYDYTIDIIWVFIKYLNDNDMLKSDEVLWIINKLKSLNDNNIIENRIIDIRSVDLYMSILHLRGDDLSHIKTLDDLSTVARILYIEFQDEFIIDVNIGERVQFNDFQYLRKIYFPGM